MFPRVDGSDTTASQRAPDATGRGCPVGLARFDVKKPPLLRASRPPGQQQPWRRRGGQNLPSVPSVAGVSDGRVGAFLAVARPGGGTQTGHQGRPIRPPADGACAKTSRHSFSRPEQASNREPGTRAVFSQEDPKTGGLRPSPTPSIGAQIGSGNALRPGTP